MNKNQITGVIRSHKINKQCFFPLLDENQCKGKIVNAHTISKSNSLKQLSNGGHVLYFDSGDNGQFIIKKIGIKKASIFPGFCAKHDNEMFSPIENKDFEANEYHSFLLGFRALTKEIYEKKRQVNLNEQLDVNSNYRQSCLLGLKDLQLQKINYDNAFRKNNFSCSNYYIIEFANTSNLLFSGAVYPEYDFQGCKIQSLDTEDSCDHISINAINKPSGGCVVFQWMSNSDVNSRFVKSFHLLDNKIKADAITQFAFESFDNLYMNHDWWHSLDKTLQQSLCEKLPCGYAKDCNLKLDGKNYNKFQSMKIHTNVSI